MESQKITNWLDNTPNQPSKFKTKNWVEINNGSYEMYSTASQIKFKTWMIRSSLCDNSDAYILVNRNIKVIFKNCAPFTDCISEINKKKEIDHGRDIDVVIPMYNLIRYNDNYLKKSGSFC